MSKEEIQTLIEALGNIRDVLEDADPTDKAEVYRQLGLRLTYRPGKRTVRAETNLDPHSWGYGTCPRRDLHTIHPSAIISITKNAEKGISAGLWSSFK